MRVPKSYNKKIEKRGTETVYFNNLKKGSKILLYLKNIKETSRHELATFDHVDGFYSYIILSNGNTINLSIQTPLVKVGDHYEIIY